MNLDTITTQLSIITDRITLIMNDNDRLKIECEVLKSTVEETEEWADIELNNACGERDELAAQLDAALTELANMS